MALVLDTGPLYASLDGQDPDHLRCLELLEGSDEELVIPDPVLVELDYWIRKYATADVWLAFAEDVRDGAYLVRPLDSSELVRAAQIQVRFSDQPIGYVDAAVLVTCEALGEEKVATLDTSR